MFTNLRELILSMPDEKTCRDYVAKQRWPDGKPVCPHCGHDKTYVIERGAKYKCASKACYKKFSVTACKMHEVDTIQHFRNIKAFHTKNKNLFTDKRFSEIDTQLGTVENASIRDSFIVVFNYFEGISIGIEQGIMDEIFMKEFFKTLFNDCANDYGTYIEYLRVERKSSRIFHRFTALAQRWGAEN